MYFYGFLSNIIKVNHFLHYFIIFLHLVSTFLHIKYLYVPYAYVSIESIDCILLSLLAFNSILLISSVNTLCLLLLNLCCVFNINLLFFYKFCMAFFKTLCINFIFFLINLFYSEVELLLNNFYNLQIYVFFSRHTFLC